MLTPKLREKVQSEFREISLSMTSEETKEASLAEAYRSEITQKLQTVKQSEEVKLSLDGEFRMSCAIESISMLLLIIEMKLNA